MNRLAYVSAAAMLAAFPVLAQQPNVATSGAQQPQAQQPQAQQPQAQDPPGGAYPAQPQGEVSGVVPVGSATAAQGQQPVTQSRSITQMPNARDCHVSWFPGGHAPVGQMMRQGTTVAPAGSEITVMGGHPGNLPFAFSSGCRGMKFEVVDQAQQPQPAQPQPNQPQAQQPQMQAPQQQPLQQPQAQQPPLQQSMPNPPPRVGNAPRSAVPQGPQSQGQR